jgi:phosphohistidine phosphatase
MARQLWLLRHAEAEPHGTRMDAERRLTKRGREQARAAGIALARMRPSFDAALYSPRVRASQTAQLAAEAWSRPQRARLAVHEPLSAGFDAGQALDALAGTGADGRVLLVGHEPDLSGVIAQLTGARVDLKKGGLAVVRLEGGGGELVLLMRPRELALIAGAASQAARGRALAPVGGR